MQTKQSNSLLIAGHDIVFFSIVTDALCGEAVNFAALELQKYIKRYTGDSLPVTTKSTGRNDIILTSKNSAGADGFEVTVKDGNLTVKGNNGRSVLYGVYTLIEKAMGFRFYAAPAAYRGTEFGAHLSEVQTVKRDAPLLALTEGLVFAESSPILYRDNYTYALMDEGFCAKHKINAQTWGTRHFTDELGGAVHFAGESGHTFRLLVPVATYGKTHPEFFAEINGKRVTTGADWSDAPQLCLTNYATVPIIVEALKGYLKNAPDAQYVSVSQNDNKLFCTCAACRKSNARYGAFGTLIRFVNEVAARLYDAYPQVRIHTYAYWGTDEIGEGLTAHKNVVVQFCPVQMCHVHALDDPDCPLNAKILARIKALSKVTENIFIYDYRSCLKYALLLLPDIFTLRSTMRCYAENKVTGIYAEGCIFTAMQPTFEELRAYLFAKLTWNPYMSESEYSGHIDDFLEGYYGAGGKFLRTYLEGYAREAKGKHITSFTGGMVSDELKYIERPDGFLEAETIEPKRLAEFASWAHALFDNAAAEATAAQKERIEAARTSLIWYELFHTMEGIMATGTEAEKAAIVARNRDLCARMRKYFMKYTIYIGMTDTTYMYDGDFTLPPSKWRYSGNIAGADISI